MEYADRDIMELDKAGGYYCRHVSAMTGEGLHSKGDIAAELAYRDREIERLRELIRAHVEASNNDDTAGDTFAALVAEVPNAQGNKPPSRAID